MKNFEESKKWRQLIKKKKNEVINKTVARII